MKQDIEADILIKDYLLGKLSQDDALQVEERLFFDLEYFQMMRAVEDDLIDDYIYGELSTNERGKFESYFLSTPERHEALRMAKALKKYNSANFAPELSSEASVVKPRLLARLPLLQSLRSQAIWWKLPLAFATLLLIVSGLWLLLWAVRSTERTEPMREAQQSPPAENKNVDEQRKSIENANIEQQRAQEQYAGQQNREPSDREPKQREKEASVPKTFGNQNYSPITQPKRPSTTVYALLIPGGLTRGDENLKEISFPANTAAVNLRLALIEDTDYRTFQTTLYSDDDKAIRRWNGLISTNYEAGKIVSLSVPSYLLNQQKYHIKLSGISTNGVLKEISTYYFRVAKR